MCTLAQYWCVCWHTTPYYFRCPRGAAGVGSCDSQTASAGFPTCGGFNGGGASMKVVFLGFFIYSRTHFVVGWLVCTACSRRMILNLLAREATASHQLQSISRRSAARQKSQDDAAGCCIQSYGRTGQEAQQVSGGKLFLEQCGMLLYTVKRPMPIEA